jgi:regulator of protease activity HflC (stomatin/prohibitin superfamily)
MTTRQYGQVTSSYSSPRALNQVQQVMRLLIWVGAFIVVVVVMSAIGVGILFVGNAVSGGQAGAVCVTPWGVVSLIVALAVPSMVSRCLYIIPEYERVVVLKLGEFVGVRGPGRFWVIPYPPYYQSAAMTLDMRIQTHVIKAAETLTKDNVPVGCEAVIFWRVEDPRTAALKVKNHAEAVFLAANSALKDTIGTLDLTELLSQRDLVAQNLEQIIDQAASNFGVDVSSVEITDVHVPTDLIQELSVRAQAERSAAAKIAEAKAELEVARQFQSAANSMGSKAMELYRLNVLERIGREEGSQIVVYGLGGDSAMGKQIAATASGAATARARPPVQPSRATTKGDETATE